LAGVALGTDQYPAALDQAYRILSDTQHRLNRERVRRGGISNNTDKGQTNFQKNRPGVTIPTGENVV